MGAEPAVSLEGARCSLRPVQPADTAFLYELATTPPMSLRWIYRGALPSPDEFAAQLWSGVLAQFVIETGSMAPAGLVVFNRASLRDGHAHLGVLCDEDRWGGGLGIEAAIIGLDYVFAVWGLRKVYLEVPAWNLAQFASIRGHLETEGILRDHLRVGATTCDLHLLSISAELFGARRHELPAAARRALGDQPTVAPADGGGPDAVAGVVCAALARQGAEGTVHPSDRLVEDLALDSLSYLEVIVDLEASLGVSLPTDDVVARTVGELGELCLVALPAPVAPAG